MRRALIVEDDPEIARLVQLHLQDIACTADLADNGRWALELFGQRPYDVVLLGLMLPDTDGLTLCRELRQRSAYVPILMLTAKTSELDRVLGLEIGADDYLTKPFSFPEPVARVKALLRRAEAFRQTAATVSGEQLKVGDLTIDLDKRQVIRAGTELDLTAREFDLLAHFARHPGRVFNRTQLLDQVWGYGHDGYEHTVNSHINRIQASSQLDAGICFTVRLPAWRQVVV